MMNKNESKYFNTAVKMDQAFLEMLEQTEYAYITVKAICEKAGVNRSTFYLHYENMDDLLSESVEYMNAHFQAHMEQDAKALIENIRDCPLEELNFITPKYLSPYLRYMREHRRLMLTALKNSKTLKLDESYNRLFRFVFEPILERYRLSPESRSYVMSFYIHGIMAIVSEWLMGGCKETIDEITAIIQQCVLRYPPKAMTLF